MDELDQAYSLLELAIEKAHKRNCSPELLEKMKDVRDVLNDACNMAEEQGADYGSKKEHDPD